MRHAFFAVLFLAVGCGGSPMVPGPVSYKTQLVPIFQGKCTACHHAGSPTHLDLLKPFDPTEGLVNRANSWTQARQKVLVVPGKPDESALMAKLVATDLDPNTEGSSMPPQLEKVTASELANIRQWITAGANDDAFFRANVAPVFGNAANLGTSIGKCSFCHTAKSPFAPNLVDAFSATGVVNIASAFGGKRVLPGEPDASVLVKKITQPLPSGVGQAMPLQYPPLTAAEIELVRKWILEGAKDN